MGGALKPAREALKPVLQQVQSIDEWLEELEKTLYAYDQRIIAARLSPQEEAILATLKRLQQSAGMTTEIELGVLFQQPELQGCDWRDLRGLYAKQRLSIKITLATFR